MLGLCAGVVNFPLTVCPKSPTSSFTWNELRAPVGGRLGALVFADLFSGESASANAATPVGGRVGRHARPRFAIGTPGQHQLATALWTLPRSHRSCNSRFPGTRSSDQRLQIASLSDSGPERAR